jgi:hypothetical protein
MPCKSRDDAVDRANRQGRHKGRDPSFLGMKLRMARGRAPTSGTPKARRPVLVINERLASGSSATGPDRRTMPIQEIVPGRLFQSGDRVADRRLVKDEKVAHR